MVIFNTLKAATHWVKWRNKSVDFYHGGYDWSESRTYIDGNLVKVVNSGDSCGCGCDTGRYSNVYVVGRIKAWNKESSRNSKLKKLV